MTDPKGIRRRRRETQDATPRDLAAWFAGEPTDGTPWSAMLYPDYVLLRERWAAWSAGRRGVIPPKGYEWIAERPPEHMHGKPYAVALEQARSCAARGWRR
jgi:hypothetical protein